MSDSNENGKPKEKRSKTKSFLYHASGASDFVYARDAIRDSVFNRDRIARLKELRDNLKENINKDYRNIPYAEFNISPLKEKEILTNLRISKQRWLIVSYLFLLIWLSSVAVCVAALAVSDIPASVYVKSFGFLAIISVIVFSLLFKVMRTEFVAWQITNQINSSAENGDFSAFRQTDWLPRMLSFSQCGVKNENP